MPNQKNQDAVKNLTEKIAKAKSIIFTDYKGLKALQADQFRAKMDEAGAKVEVTKNTLMKVALKESKIKIDEVEKTLEGSTLTIFSYADPIAPLKKLYEFMKAVSLPNVKLGFMDGKFYSAAEVKTLSELPSREVLLARILAGLNSPITGFVNVLSGSKRNFVYVLKSIADKKQS